MWCEKGKELKVKEKQGFKNFYMYSEISPATGDNYSLILPFVCTDMMNLYLDKLSQEFRDQLIVLIMDQAGWHKSKELIIPDNIRIIYLPPYSPELNPVERFWRYLKNELLHNVVYETIDNLTKRLVDFYMSIENILLKKLCNCSYL